MPSAEAHAVLAAHDTELPALAMLLDDDPLSQRLEAPVARSYLRYKPGTSALALIDVGGRAAIASARRPEDRAKRAKALQHVGPDDVLLDAPDDGLLVVDAMADRHVPALRALVRSGHVGPWLTGLGVPVEPGAVPRTLAHKPARRWVGRLPVIGTRTGEHVVLRAYVREEYGAALAAHGLIDPRRSGSVRLPRVLATHRRGLIALEHLPGRPLDETVGPATLRRLGACLGELHSSGPARLVETRPEVTTDGLAALAPVLGPAVAAAADVDAAARAALRPGQGSNIHGDFSLDQVVADGHDLGIIDLDRVRVGNPLDDLASLLASAGLTALPRGGVPAAVEVMDRMRGPLLAGHASTWSAPVGEDLGPRTALALLTRAAEPFRTGHPDWPETTRELIVLAGNLASGQVAA